MPDMEKVFQTKNQIIEAIKKEGPTLPTKIARQTDLSPLFVSAFLSEMVSERKIKISNMKIGSSPLYFIQGQEDQLKNFTEFLNHKEKEAYYLLENGKVLLDEEQHPAIRVALRSIKDFAIPIQARISEKSILFWKYYLISQEETKKIIEEKINQTELSRNIEPKTEQKEIIKEIPKEEEKEKTLDIFDNKPKLEEKEDAVHIEKNLEQTIKEEPQKPNPSNPKTTNSEFIDSLKEYLKKNNLEIIEEISSKKKEFIAKISHSDRLFGEQNFYLISKEKKKVNENDLAVALQKAQSEKMQALIISPGELDKKAQSYLDEWKNLIKFSKID